MLYLSSEINNLFNYPIKFVTGRIFWSSTFLPTAALRSPMRYHWIDPSSLLDFSASALSHLIFLSTPTLLNCILPSCKSLCNVWASLKDRSSHEPTPPHHGTDTARFSFCNPSHKSWNMATNPPAASGGRADPHKVCCWLASLPSHTRKQAARWGLGTPPVFSVSPVHTTWNIRPTLRWPILRK